MEHIRLGGGWESLVTYSFGAERIIRLRSRTFVCWRCILLYGGGLYGWVPIVVDRDGLGGVDESKHSAGKNVAKM